MVQTYHKAVDISLLALAATMLSCQLTLMYVFVGGNGGGDARALLVIQAWSAAIALLVFLWEAMRNVLASGLGNTFRAVWHALPAWAVLAMVVLNSLVIIGELSLYLRMRMTGQAPLWFEHAPLLCVLACSLAFVVLLKRSSMAQDGSRAPVGRW